MPEAQTKQERAQLQRRKALEEMAKPHAERHVARAKKIAAARQAAAAQVNQPPSPAK